MKTWELADSYIRYRLDYIQGPNIVRIVHDERFIASQIFPYNFNQLLNDQVKLYAINMKYSR